MGLAVVVLAGNADAVCLVVAAAVGVVIRMVIVMGAAASVVVVMVAAAVLNMMMHGKAYAYISGTAAAVHAYAHKGHGVHDHSYCRKHFYMQCMLHTAAKILKIFGNNYVNLLKSRGETHLLGVGAGFILRYRGVNK